MRGETPTIGARWPAFLIMSRVAAAIFGGYLFAWGCAALGSVSLAGLGMARSEAVVSATMPAFVAYLVATVWAFAARRVGRVWLTLAGGGGLMTLLAHRLVGGG
jgi:hypothetical protein